MALDLFLFADTATSRSSLKQIKAAADPDRTIDGQNNLKVSQYRYLCAAYALGNTLGQAQLQSGSLNSIVAHNIEPIDVGTSPSAYPPVANYMNNPIPLTLGESLGAYGVNYASELNYLAVILADAPPQPVQGNWRTMRCTGSTTVTAATWSNCALTLPSNIKAGTYTIVGCRFHSATGIVGRLRMGSTPAHPGSVCMSTVLKEDWRYMRYGLPGILGTFAHDAPPTADFYCSSADTAQIVMLDVIGPT